MRRKISAESPSPGFAKKLVEGITRATHRADRVALASVGKHLAETADMDIDIDGTVANSDAEKGSP
jgi:hypothetical protein